MYYYVKNGKVHEVDDCIVEPDNFAGGFLLINNDWIKHVDRVFVSKAAAILYAEDDMED